MTLPKLDDEYGKDIYRDREGKPISLKRYAELFADLDYRFVMKSFVRAVDSKGVGIDELDEYVITIWTGVDMMLRTDDTMELFETTHFRRVQPDDRYAIRLDEKGTGWKVYQQRPSSNELAALVQHNTMLAKARRNVRQNIRAREARE